MKEKLGIYRYLKHEVEFFFFWVPSLVFRDLRFRSGFQVQGLGPDLSPGADSEETVFVHLLTTLKYRDRQIFTTPPALLSFPFLSAPNSIFSFSYCSVWK